jgi:tetratricopeptide (TPR) repeat protein
MNRILKLLLLILLLQSSICFAEVKEITSEGTYNMGDGETPTVAESRALLQAKRVAVEQAGTYIESYSKIQNFQLTQDEIQVLASGVMEVTILDRKRTVVGDGINFWVKIKARVSTDKIDAMANRVKERTIIEDYKKLQKDYEKGQKEIDDLKKRLREAKSEGVKKQVEAKITYEEKQFQARTWFDKGAEHNLNGEYDDAIGAFSKAIGLDSNNANYYFGRGFSYSRKHQEDRAIEDYNKAIALNPSYAGAYNFRGLAYKGKGQLDRAIQDHNRAIALQPNKEFFYLCRGIAYGAKGDFDKAIEDYNKSILIEPNKAEAYIYRGGDYGIKKQNDRALADFNKAITLAPRNPKAYLWRGLFYSTLGQAGEAIFDLIKACELGDEDGCEELKKIYGITVRNPSVTASEAYACVKRGVELFRKRQYEKAIQEFTKAIDLEPRYFNAFYNRGCSYLAKGNHEKAIEDFSIAIAINPKYGDAFFNRGLAYGKKAQLEKANADFQKACELGKEAGCEKVKILSGNR